MTVPSTHVMQREARAPGSNPMKVLPIGIDRDADRMPAPQPSPLSKKHRSKSVFNTRQPQADRGKEYKTAAAAPRRGEGDEWSPLGHPYANMPTSTAVFCSCPRARPREKIVRTLSTGPILYDETALHASFIC
jgi:hypothetical protein